MSWFRTDHDRGDHPKFRRAVQIDPLSTSLWLNAGEAIARAESDGIVRSYLLADYAHRAAPGLAAPKLAKLVEALVVPVLWHTAGTVDDCSCALSWSEQLGDVPHLDAGDYLFHDWFDYQLPKADSDTLAKQHELRKRRLWADKQLVATIRARDRDTCRYCATPVKKIPGAKGKYALELDHVDPFGENTAGNVVVACGPCNRRKGQRTPEQARMPLLPEPGPYGLVEVRS